MLMLWPFGLVVVVVVWVGYDIVGDACQSAARWLSVNVRFWPFSQYTPPHESLGANVFRRADRFAVTYPKSTVTVMYLSGFDRDSAAAAGNTSAGLLAVSWVCLVLFINKPYPVGTDIPTWGS